MCMQHATHKDAHEVTYLLDRDRQDYSAVEGERQELLSNPCLASETADRRDGCVSPRPESHTTQSNT